MGLKKKEKKTTTRENPIFAAVVNSVVAQRFFESVA